MPRDLDEGDRDVPVLRVGRLGSQLARVRGGQQDGQIHARRIEERRHHLGALGAVREQHGARRGSRPSRRSSKRRAVGALSAISPACATASVSTQAVASAPATISSRWMPPTRKKWNSPLWTPIETRSRTGPAEVERRRMPVERLLHPHGRRACAQGVVLAPEEQQDGVAAELQQVGVVGVGAPDQLREGGVDHAGYLLGALPAALRERLGEVGEAGDVGEDERPLEALRTRRRRVAQPVDREARDERPERIRRLESRACRDLHRTAVPRRSCAPERVSLTA